ncbi:esterase [Shewanella sp. KX20019]|uniref:alpha/beta hydrolase n=1 Tax=Shewanella sp. KX20019 TaxID=2803864 RepID=UPI0019254B7C|nr:alpha/beta hydrolase-fold protein [Shewanella sp. KX20019]QQX80579.1 esterase [Shewanella sp. KX20019]
MRSLLFSLFLLCPQFVSATDLILAQQVQLQSNSLDEQRSLLVKLPKQYNDNNKTYPVLYVLHAQWDMLSTLSTLDLLAKQAPNFIVVGIEGRGKELRPNDGKPSPFATFISKEVIPHVRNNYRVAPYSILSGHSNAGRFVLDYWLNDSSLFSQYFAFSPSLEDGYIVNRVSKSTLHFLESKAPLTMTIANEGEHMQKPFTELSDKLASMAGASFISKTFPTQSHQTTKHSSMQFALQTTFAHWQPTDEVKTSGLNALKKHYADLSEKFGFKVIIPNETLQRLTFYYATSEKESAIQELDKHVAFTLKQTAEGLVALFEIADYLSGNGYEAAGNNLTKQICSLTSDSQRCVD